MIVDRWLLTRFGMDLAGAVFLFTGLFSVFDLLANGASVTAEAESPVLPLFYYGLLRLSPLVVFVLPFASLVAAMVTFARLAARWEMVALQSVGFSAYRAALVLAGGAVCLGAAQFVFTEKVVTATESRLAAWKADDYRGLPDLEARPDDRPEWLAGDHFIARLEKVSPDGTALERPTLIWRNGEGLTTRYLRARRARYREDGSWVLMEVFERDLEAREVRRVDRMPLEIDLKPPHFASLNRSPALLSFSKLRMLGSGRVETQAHSPRFYGVTWHRRLSQPLGAVVMVLIAAPLTVQLPRGGRAVSFAVSGLALGFLYFVVVRIFQSLGETGELPVIPAAWGPQVLFALIAAAVLVRQQR